MNLTQVLSSTVKITNDSHSAIILHSAKIDIRIEIAKRKKDIFQKMLSLDGCGFAK